MSESSRPTRWPSWASETARLAATVDLPTPPLPLATATTCRTSGISERSWEIAFWADSSRDGGLVTFMLTSHRRHAGEGAQRPLHLVAHLLAGRRVLGRHPQVHHHASRRGA